MPGNGSCWDNQCVINGRGVKESLLCPRSWCPPHTAHPQPYSVHKMCLLPRLLLLLGLPHLSVSPSALEPMLWLSLWLILWYHCHSALWYWGRSPWVWYPLSWFPVLRHRCGCVTAHVVTGICLPRPPLQGAQPWALVTVVTDHGASRVWQVVALTTLNHLQRAQSPYSPCEM